MYNHLDTFTFSSICLKFMYTKFLGPNFNCPKFLVIDVVVLSDKDFIYVALAKYAKSDQASI